MVIIDEDVTVGHRPMYTEIMRRARDAHLWGASVFRGIEGFGSTGRLHTSRILDLADALPAMIVIVDRREAIEAFLPQLEEIGVHGVVAIDDVDLPFGAPESLTE